MIRVMALAEHCKKTAIFTFEDPLNTCISASGEQRGIEAVARAETMMHSLAHRFILRRHQARRLSACQPERIFESRRVKI